LKKGYLRVFGDRGRVKGGGKDSFSLEKRSFPPPLVPYKNLFLEAVAACEAFYGITEACSGIYGIIAHILACIDWVCDVFIEREAGGGRGVDK